MSSHHFGPATPTKSSPKTQAAGGRTTTTSSGVAHIAPGAATASTGAQLLVSALRQPSC